MGIVAKGRPKLVMKTKHLAAFLFAFSLAGHAMPAPPDKVDSLADAISHAEGFGKRHAIPTRYHNPGDLKALRRSKRLDGQVGIGKGGHIIFKSDAAGRAALREYIARMLDGRSRHFNPSMTLSQVAREYAQNWRPWVKIVSNELGVPPSITLRAYFREDAVEPPAIGDVVPAASFPQVATFFPAPVSNE